MKKLVLLLTLFTLLMVGCRPPVEEPQPAQPVQPVETFDYSLLYTDNDPFWGPQQDQRVHKDSDETRLKALKMGANIIQYVFSK